jgi:predicted  nucleic acid-binding Zn-ribbon protein
MSESKIDVSESAIRILDLIVPSRDVAAYVRALSPVERAQAVVHAVEVGIFCLERARAGQDLNFVRREIDSLLGGIQQALGKLPEETSKHLGAKIGTGEGQVLAPLQSLVRDVSNAATDKMQEIRKLLQEDIDPTKETSSLGRALRDLRDLLDPRRTDSIQGSLNAAVSQVTADSGPLAKAVKDLVSRALKPLEEKITDLAKDVRGREAAAEALEQTTLKGVTYEEEVVQILENWARGLGFEVHHVGTDNRPGDVMVVVADPSLSQPALRIVVEARDRQHPLGRLAIGEGISTAMAERNAGAAVYVSKTRDGLAKEIGEWAEGTAAQGRWVACTHEHLVTAVRFLIAQDRLQAIRAAAPSVDATSIEAQIQRIRTVLSRIKTISTRVTDLRGSADEIQHEADAVREEIRGALSEIEEALRGSSRAVNSPSASSTA